ncbi:MAG: TlpA disulfide reductase family protein [Chloroflexota bacterium]|jgi:cytochrome c biogenesis protein CcmG, thiol:disulfide interchange protein DsbE
MRERLEWGALILLTAILGASWIYLSRDTSASTGPFPLTTAPHIGNLAPDFTLQAIDGSTFTLSDFSAGDGRPVVLNFWATWCPPCRVEMPYFDRVAARYGERAAIVSINQAESPETIATFAERNGLTYPLLIDQDFKINNLYGVLNLPTTIFIDRNGVVREVLIGTISQAVLEDRVEGLLE